VSIVDPIRDCCSQTLIASRWCTSQPGLHLVICGVVPHFVNDDMFGWVRVLP
jgi:hypothetical protein